MSLYSIVIPTYNRIQLIDETIQSAVDFIKSSESGGDIIIVDDASEDGTFEHIKKVWGNDVDNRLIKISRNKKRLGVAGSRNRGVLQSQNRWIVFLDSDDLLIPENSLSMKHILEQSDYYPIVFFRCINLETAKLIGPPIGRSYDLSLADFLNYGTPGECLPVIRGKCMAEFPYDEMLNGCEGIAYAEIIKNFGNAKVEALILRRYRTANPDRLSAGRGLKNRLNDIETYHKRVLVKYFRHLKLKTLFTTSLKIVWYRINKLTLAIKK